MSVTRLIAQHIQLRTTTSSHQLLPKSRKKHSLKECMLPAVFHAKVLNRSHLVLNNAALALGEGVHGSWSSRTIILHVLDISLLRHT